MLWASTGLITLVLLTHQPGRIVPETKFDVLVDPVRFLGRALTAWDPSAGFGRLQNQSVGYLFPMGAFSAAGRALGLPPWLVQRLWLALVISLALWGAHRVAAAVGVGHPGGRLVSAWCYALAPATLSITTFQSAGQLPYALVPHVLATLLTATPNDSPRRTAGRSTLWLAAMGGVNGASAFAVLPLVGVWFAVANPGPQRRRLLAWWSAGAVAASLWWIVPLLVSVRYGLRFTDYTETAEVTTLTESATEVLRGTGNWLSYLQTGAGSWLPGGWALASSRLAIAGSVIVAAGALAGLARRDAPGRSWLGPSLLIGVSVIGVGYAGAAGGPFASAAQALLDGPLAPFRNVHKFSALVRLPMAIGLGHMVAVATVHVGSMADGRRASPRRRQPVGADLVPSLAIIAIVLAIAPALGSKLTAPGSFEDVPDSWRQAATWLDRQGDDNRPSSRALVLPGSSFGEYAWGRPLDEPLPSLLDGPWAVRDLVPLGGNGSTRVLDAIDQALATEALPDGFLVTLQRMGIGHLVVRNDLDRARTGGPTPATVRRLLSEVDGLRRVAAFGSVAIPTGGDGRLASRPGDLDAAGGTPPRRELDIYAVANPTPVITGYPAAGSLVVSGGPEAVVALPPALGDGRAMFLAVDLDADPGLVASLTDPVLVATDTARRRDVGFGAVRDSASYTLTKGGVSPITGDTPSDRWPTGTDAGLTTAEVRGAASVSDSRRPAGILTPEAQPFAAFDANPDTAWVPQLGKAGEWLQVRLDGAQELRSVALRLPRVSGKRIESVRVRTDRGEVAATFTPSGTATADLPSGKTTFVRVVIDTIATGPDTGPIGLSEVAIEGLTVARPLVLPPVSSSGSGAAATAGDQGAQVVMMARDRRDRLDRIRRDEDGAFDRSFPWHGGEAQLTGSAVAVGGPALDELLASVAPTAEESDLQALASSRYRDHGAFSADAAFDGDPATAWVSDVEVSAPRLSLSWKGTALIDSLVLDVLAEGVDRIDSVEVTTGETTSTHQLDDSGRVMLTTPVATDRLELAFPIGGPDGREARLYGVAEVEVPALAGRVVRVADRSQGVELTCGDGPEVIIDGASIPTRATTTVGDLLDGAPVRWQSCTSPTLDAGQHRFQAKRGALFATNVTIAAPEPGAPRAEAAGSNQRAVEIDRWDDEYRRVSIGDGAATILATTENPNDGWAATLDGEQLQPVRVDGWRQGWIVPAGAAGTIDLRFGPGRIHRMGLLVGLMALLALGAAAALRPRRSWPPAAPVPRRWGRGPLVTGAAAVGVGLVGVALAGPVAVVVIPLAVLPVLHRHLSAISAGATLMAGSVAIAGAGTGFGSATGTFSPSAQVLATVALLAVGASLLPPRPPDATVSAAADSTLSTLRRFGRRSR